MIADLKPYAEYRSVDPNWLGAVPAHWQCIPHRALFREIKDQGHVHEPLLSVTISRGVIPQNDLLKNSSKKDSSNLDKSKYKLVQPGDIAYNKMRAWQGAAGASRHRGIVSPAYIVQRLRSGGDPQYFHHVFRTPGFAKEAERWSYGITSDQWSLRPEHFKMIYSPVPSPKEQAAIVRFLADADRRINRLIRNKRRLIGLLNEQKQAIITQAVTRGLDPSVPMKESGIEWLGRVPKAWQIRRLTSITRRIGNGYVGPTRDILQEDGVRYIQSLHIKDGSIAFKKPYFVSQEWLTTQAKCRLREGDAVIVQTGDIGQVALVDSEHHGAGCHALIIVRPIATDLRTDFLVAFLRSSPGYETLKRIETGALHPHLNCRHVKGVRIPLPAINEQSAIANHVREIERSFAHPLGSATRELQLLSEYRTRLIADVVTGKLDVRAAAADLPDPADTEPEPEDVLDDDFDAVEEELEEEVVS